MKILAFLGMFFATVVMASANTTAHAFYNNNSGQWSVVGELGDYYSGGFHYCAAETEWPNGDYLSLRFDPNDGEVYMVIYDSQQTFYGNEGVSHGAFVGAAGTRENFSFSYMTIDESSILIPMLHYGAVDNFAHYAEMHMFTETHDPMIAGLRGSSRALEMVEDCLTTYYMFYN